VLAADGSKGRIICAISVVYYAGDGTNAKRRITNALKLGNLPPQANVDDYLKYHGSMDIALGQRIEGLHATIETRARHVSAPATTPTVPTAKPSLHGGNWRSICSLSARTTLVA
jgi:hypothetical protein